MVESPVTPKYHRQRFLLLLLQMAGGNLSKTELQKLLFLANKEAGLTHYDFVPYRFGCFSFQAQADLEILRSRRWIDIVDGKIVLISQRLTKTGLSTLDLKNVHDLIARTAKLRGKALVRYVYRKYPYFAIKSEIAQKIMNIDDLKVIQQQRHSLKYDGQALFTVGYEGSSFEAYINKLIKNDIRLLCDVRKNPLSRKFGFSKGRLSNALPKIGIAYVHIPELGIISQKRQNLNGDIDYINLFKEYRLTLPSREPALLELVSLLEQYQRIALTCFEKDHISCHRHCVSDHLENRLEIEAVHL